MRSAAESPGKESGNSPSPAAVREHLGELCQAPSFRSSPRSVRFLSYVVEETLAGRKDNLKERTIGVSAFNRPADYDSESDPVVRQVAGEVRKRLVQYYAGPGSHHTIRIEIPPGSYAAAFRECGPVAAVESTPAPQKPWKVWAAAASGVILLCAGFVALRVFVNQTPLDAFWEPVVSGSPQIVLCIGKGAGFRGATAVRTEQELNVHAADALVLSRVSAFLAQRKKPVLQRYVDQLTFAELRENPAVLIGAFNNAWSLRLTSGLRYEFRAVGRNEWIEDTSRPNGQKWGLSNIPNDGNVAEDYAIVTRVLNPSTGRMLVVLGGLTYHATMAAGEFVTNPESMRSAQSMLPPNWRKMNLQLVLATKVTTNFNGPPRIIAVHAW